MPAESHVGVVIPCYDDGATLAETVASVLGQTKEVVVVDDGSTDAHTLDVLARLETEGIHVVRGPNRGVAAARMSGVHATSAPYVFPLDADDLAEPGALAALAAALDEHPEAAVAFGYVRTFGTYSYVSKFLPRLDPWLLTYMNHLPSASLIRRSALLEAGGWRSGIYHEDWDLWLALAERGWTGIRVPRLAVHYRVHRGRRWAETNRHYEEIVAGFCRDHEALFRARRENWRRSRAPWRLKLALPIVDRLPLLRAYDKRRIGELVRRPLRVTRLALSVRAASARR